MKTAVIYARYSCDAQTEQSIEGQLRVCEEYAQKNDILIICYTGISSQMNIPTPYALKASFQIFGWGMRTHIQNTSVLSVFDVGTRQK